jgi:hypothetical protein
MELMVIDTRRLARREKRACACHEVSQQGLFVAALKAQGGNRVVDTKLRERLESALSGGELRGPSRLVSDARRLWRRVEALVELGLIPQPDLGALELACFALQLPMRSIGDLPIGRFGKTHLRDRTEQSAELLIAACGKNAPEELIDRTTTILLDLPHRRPSSDDARLLADALSLDDFGVSGLIAMAMQMARQAQGVEDVAASSEKREQYGYWEARLKDFHFEPVRKIARERLERARTVTALLSEELNGQIP